MSAPKAAAGSGALPNETWQSDFTHYRLANSDDVEIITWLDDCTRYALHVTAHQAITGAIVTTTFRETLAAHGIPTTTLTDNGMVYTVRLAGGCTQHLRDRAATPARGPEELPTSPPDHLRQSREIPADDEEMATSPTRPTRQPRPAADAPRHLRG